MTPAPPPTGMEGRGLKMHRTSGVDWGVAAVVAATVIVVGLVFVGTCIRKVGGRVRSSAALGQEGTAAPSGPNSRGQPSAAGDAQPPTMTVAPAGRSSLRPPGDGIAGGRLEAKPGRAAEKRKPGVPSARTTSCRADGTESQARPASSAERRALDLLAAHESRNGTRMVGDGGKARGWLQQHEANWREGCAALGVAWPWPEATVDLAKCEAVARANWRRYAPEALTRGDVEELVRRHRLPSDPWRADNGDYWRRVKAKGGGR